MRNTREILGRGSGDGETLEEVITDNAPPTYDPTYTFNVLT